MNSNHSVVEAIIRLERKLDRLYALQLAQAKAAYEGEETSRGSADLVLGDSESEDESEGEGEVGVEIDDEGVWPGVSLGWRGVMPSMTTKQHAALQMLIRGAGNQEIADRLGVSINTAKVHVRSIAKKMGMHRRQRIAEKVSLWMEEISPQQYEAMSGGLPKDWDLSFSEPDSFASLYR